MTMNRDSLDSVRLGPLEARLAINSQEIDAAQALRYRVFYDEMKAQPTKAMAARQRDFDDFDAHCEHLLIFDKRRENLIEQVVATYRLIRRPAATALGRFYSEAEYDISALKSYKGEILELGRSCIEAPFRTGGTMQLLWRALTLYLQHHDIALMFGCASLPGTEPALHAEALSYLYYHHLAPPAFCPRALDARYIDMRLLPKEALDNQGALDRIRPRMLNSLPPLIKGYLRVGGFVGDGAVIDHEFNTTDICVIVKTDLMSDRYSKHYDLGNTGGRSDER